VLPAPPTCDRWRRRFLREYASRGRSLHPAAQLL